MGTGSGNRGSRFVIAAVFALQQQSRPKPMPHHELGRDLRAKWLRVALTLRLIPVFYHGRCAVPENTSATDRSLARSSGLLGRRRGLAIARRLQLLLDLGAFLRRNRRLLASRRQIVNGQI